MVTLVGTGCTAALGSDGSWVVNKGTRMGLGGRWREVDEGIHVGCSGGLYGGLGWSITAQSVDV